MKENAQKNPKYHTKGVIDAKMCKNCLNAELFLSKISQILRSNTYAWQWHLEALDLIFINAGELGGKAQNKGVEREKLPDSDK